MKRGYRVENWILERLRCNEGRFREKGDVFSEGT